MKPIRRILIPNGDMMMPYEIYRCEVCDKEVEEMHPRYEDDNGIYCGECAFIQGLITEQEYIHDFLFSIPAVRAAVHDGKIYVLTGRSEKFDWEKNSKEVRHSQENTEWRRKVFERDNFTCVVCGKVGGTLNAHHIKPFAQFPDQRFVVSNGITVCRECHKKIHKDKPEQYLCERKSKNGRTKNVCKDNN